MAILIFSCGEAVKLSSGGGTAIGKKLEKHRNKKGHENCIEVDRRSFPSKVVNPQ